MMPLSMALPRAASRLELPCILLLAAIVFLSVPVHAGRIGLSWDSLNHHVYLGWLADGGRIDRDYMAAGGQAAQWPYLYWPLYKLTSLGVSGRTAGIVLAALHLLAVPPVWLVARALLPGETAADALLRAAAVALSLMSAVPLKTLESTGNDFLAAIPLLWAVAVAIRRVAAGRPDGRSVRGALLAGALAGVSVSCKFSNAPLAVLLPGVFLFVPGTVGGRVRLAATCALGAALGFAASYGHWGWYLWETFGNPIFPFAEPFFAEVRTAVGWKP